MGGNKVAPPKKGDAGQVGTGKVYSGKSAPAQGGITGGAGPRKFQSNMNVAGGGSAKELQVLEGQVEELKMNNDTLDREREFYFGKLRDIEEMLQKRGLDQDPLGSEVLKILYASEEEHVEVDEKGNLTITQSGENQAMEQ